MFLRILIFSHLSDSIADTSGSLITRSGTCHICTHKRSCENDSVARLFANGSQQVSRTERKRCVWNNSRSCATSFANTELIIDDVFEKVISEIAEFVHKDADLRSFCSDNATHSNDLNGMLFAIVCKTLNMNKTADMEGKTEIDNVFGNPVNQFMMATKKYMNSFCELRSKTRVHEKRKNKQQNWSNAAALFYQKHMRSCATSAWGSTQHNESSSSQAVGDDLPWLKTAMTACRAFLAKMWACALLLCVVLKTLCHILFRICPFRLWRHNGTLDTVVLCAAHALFFARETHDTCVKVLAVIVLAAKCFGIHAPCHLLCGAGSVLTSWILASTSSFEAQVIAAIWSWKEPSFPPKSKFTVELLRTMAAKATEKVGKSAGCIIVCTYKGQKQKGSRGYEQEPSKWNRNADAHRQVKLDFEWSEKNEDGTQWSKVVSVRDDNLMERGIPDPEDIKLNEEIRVMKKEIETDFQKGHTCYNNEWRGFPKETGKAVQKIWFKRDGRSVAALVCDTSGTRRAWCLCATKKRTEIDIKGAWCLLECMDTATKEKGKKKAGKIDLDFDPSWDEDLEFTIKRPDIAIMTIQVFSTS